MKIYTVKEIWWDDIDGTKTKLLDAYYEFEDAVIHRDLMIEQYSFDYEHHKRNYQVEGVNLK